MVFFWLTLLNITALLEPYNIVPLQDLISLSLSTNFANSCNHQLIFISNLLNGCYNISRALLPLVFPFIFFLIFKLLLMLMLIGLVALMIVEVQVVIVSFLALI